MTAPATPLNILFLCTHNAGRSILAEALLRHMGQGRFRGYSAGSSPMPDQQANPLALDTLHHAGISSEGLHSKGWDVFAQPEAPHMDLVITVCDNAAGETCPVWPGHPATVHWGYADPALLEGEAQQREAFRQTLHQMHLRLEFLVNLPAAGLDRLLLAQAASELARR